MKTKEEVIAFSRLLNQRKNRHDGLTFLVVFTVIGLAFYAAIQIYDPQTEREIGNVSLPFILACIVGMFGSALWLDKCPKAKIYARCDGLVRDIISLDEILDEREDEAMVAEWKKKFRWNKKHCLDDAFVFVPDDLNELRSFLEDGREAKLKELHRAIPALPERWCSKIHARMPDGLFKFASGGLG